jgi:sporulation protein YtfJ
MDHEINTLLKVSLEHIKEMIDVDTIIGEAIIVSEELKVIPISRVRMGFLAGGTDITSGTREENPFGGGTGGTIFISPIAFLVCKNNEVSILHLENSTHLYEKVIDSVPSITSKIANLFQDMTEIKKI